MTEAATQQAPKAGTRVPPKMVKVKIDVPSWALIDNHGTLGVTVNGTQFQDGQEYEVPEHVARSIEDIMARAWEHDEQTDGEGRHVRGITGKKPSNRKVRGF